MSQSCIVLVDLSNAAIGQDHRVLKHLLGAETISLTCAHRVDSQSLKKSGCTDSLGLAVDEGVLLWRDVLQDHSNGSSRPKPGLVIVHLLNVVDVANLEF